MAGEERPPTIRLTPLPRRAVLKGSAAVAGSTVAGGVLPVGAAGTRSTLGVGRGPLAQTEPATPVPLAASQQATPDALADYEPQALTAEELETLKAVIGRLIPNDDLGPGAVEAGVFVYIDRALAGPDAAMLPVYQEGLAAIATAAGEDAFADLAAEAQDELLTQAEQQGLTGSPEGFMGMVLEHTRQGMFGDPVWGGNINFAGWSLIGYPGMKLLWLPEEQRLDTEIEVTHTSVGEFGGSPELYEGDEGASS